MQVKTSTIPTLGHDTLSTLSCFTNTQTSCVELIRGWRKIHKALETCCTRCLFTTWMSTGPSTRRARSEVVVIDLAKLSGHGNAVASRLAFLVLARMTAVWGGPDVATIAANPAAPTGPATPKIPGFDGFAIERFHPVCWEVLQDPQFRPKDAQTKQILSEIAGLEQTIYIKTGEAFIQHLQANFFPTMGIDGNEFLRSLTTATDKRTFAVPFN